MASDVPPGSPARAGAVGGSTSLGSGVGSPQQAWGTHSLPDAGDAGSLSAPSRQAAGAGSPWQFQLNVNAANRVRSGERSSTPVLGQKYAVQRALSSGRTSAAQPTAARAAYESTLLKAVRTQIESFEEKVGSQINSLRDQQQSDRLREAAFARLEEKMSTAEGNQPKLDRRLAELAGNFKGLSDEMQAQIRRVDLMDERLWEWRRQFEEDLRQKHVELESSIQKVPSNMRVMVSAVEENQKRLAARLQRLEAESSDRNILHDETRESVNHLFARFETLENQHLDHIEIAKAGLAGSLPSRGPTLGDDSVGLIGLLEQRLDDLMGKVERMFQDTHETHARVAEQEEQHKTMRTLLDQNDGQVRLLKEKVENGNWDVKLDLVKQAVQEESKQKIAQHERIELLAKRLEFQEQAQEDLRSAQQRLPPMRLLDGEDITTNGGPSVQECFQRLDNTEQTLEIFAAQMESMRADAGLGPRMTELVVQLKDMVPKVIEHDRLIKEVQGGGVPPEIYAEMSSIRSEVDAWRQSVSGDEAAQPQLKQLIEKLREEVKQVGAVPTAFHGEMDAMKRELNDLKSQTQDAHPGMQADLAALKQELISLKSEPQAVLRDLGALKQELQSSRSLPQEPHPSVTADLEALKQHLSDLKSKPQEAHPAVLQDLERIKHEMNSFKSQPQEVHPTLLQDLENLKQDLRSLKSQPKVSSEDLAPHVEQLNLELRSYIDRHASQAKENNPDGHHLVYPLTGETLAQGAALVEQVRDSAVVDPAQRVQEVLRRHRERSGSLQWLTRSGSDELLVCFTDFEPDDSMAVAQLWQWFTEKGRIRGPPLVIFQANLQEKDCGTVLEKKQLVAQLMLGLPSYYMLAKDGDTISGHPQHQGLLDRRQAYLDGICEDLVRFEGSLIHLCVMAPGSGNLAAILRELKARGSWPLRAKWRISMYSGSFNMRGTTPADIAALSEIMACSDLPLLDVAKFPFFGGSDCHKWTDSLTTFATPSFADDLANRFPDLAAALKLFNDEFNARLIGPEKLIKKDLEPEEAARFSTIRGLFDPSDTGKLQEYARALLNDEGLMSKVPGFKKPTVNAFAYGGCDSPLCDQLLFLHEWLSDRRPGFINYEEGYWRYNEEKAFVEIVPSPEGLPHPMKARRPVVASPSNEEHLQEMRHALKDYLMRHLQALDCHIREGGSRHLDDAWRDQHRAEAGGAGGASKEALQEAVNMLRSEIGASREETQRGFHEHLGPVKEEMRGMRELRTSEDEAARAATVELRALQSELLSFKDRGQSHVEDTCSKEELSRLTALATESKQISSSVLEEMDRLRKDMSTLREASKAAPARDDEEVVLQELRRIAELSASNQEAAAGAMRDVADVRRQLGEAKASSSQDAAQVEELRQLREVALEGQRTASSVLGEVEGLRKRVEAGQAGTAGIERLKADVEALQAELAKEEEADRKDHERLLARVDGLCDRVAEASQSSTADVQALRLDMDALKAQVRAVAAAPPAAGAAAAPAAAADDDLSGDDEAEHRAHVRLLERVDEVCERLDEVDRALSASALAAPQAGAAGIPAKFAEKLDAVVGRVEHLQSVEQRMEAKFSQFTEKMQASRSAPRSSPLSPYD